MSVCFCTHLSAFWLDHCESLFEFSLCVLFFRLTASERNFFCVWYKNDLAFFESTTMMPCSIVSYSNLSRALKKTRHHIVYLRFIFISNWKYATRIVCTVFILCARTHLPNRRTLSFIRVFLVLSHFVCNFKWEQFHRNEIRLFCCPPSFNAGYFIRCRFFFFRFLFVITFTEWLMNDLNQFLLTLSCHFMNSVHIVFSFQ